jgi:hypothetical protein
MRSKTGPPAPATVWAPHKSPQREESLGASAEAALGGRGGECASEPPGGHVPSGRRAVPPARPRGCDRDGAGCVCTGWGTPAFEVHRGQEGFDFRRPLTRARRPARD